MEEVHKENEKLEKDVLSREKEMKSRYENETPKQRSSRLQEYRKALPIYEYKKEILVALERTQTLVVIGETGSGKSTQISQFLYEAGYSKKGMIGVTQPRRVGAVSVSRRVAEEMGVTVGDEVGYQVRFSDISGPYTIIKYLTDGCLLRECLIDPDLRKYSVIVLDEAHERSVHTDILFGLMKKAVQRRPELKLLITSATLEEDKFSKFFGNCPIFFVPGRSFPVDIFYLERNRSTSDYADAAIETVLNIHQKEPPGDILVFLTGQHEIETTCKRIRKKVEKMYKTNPEVDDMIVLPLYAALPPGEQVLVFEPPPANTRKVVIATNIAETSLTVDGIVYVVDPGYVKQKGFNPRTGVETLQVTMISQVAAAQRAGRAGRTRAGKCFRLYTKYAFSDMEPQTVPEIQRTNLANTVLCLKALGVDDVLGFDFLDPPDPFLLIQATKQLYYLEALNDDGTISEIGKQMSAFPLEPTFSKMLLASIDRKCSEEMVTIIAMMSIENLFYKPSDKEKQDEADELRAALYQQSDKIIESDITGDHFFLLYIYNQWLKHEKSKKWCSKYYIQPRHMFEAGDIRNQLLDIMKQQNHQILSSNRDSTTKYERLGKAICQGLFINTARRVNLPSTTSKLNSSHQFAYMVIKQNQLAFIHPQNAIILSEKPVPPFVVFSELVQSTKAFMRGVCAIKYEWVGEHLNRVSKLDLNKLIGRDIREILSSAMPEEENKIEKKTESHQTEDQLQEAFARKNNDETIEAARERYLKRRKLQPANRR